MKGFTGLAVDLSVEDGGWAEHIGDSQVRHGMIERVGCLPDATSAGKPAFELLATLDDGSKVVLETTWALMDNATRVLRARYGDPDRP
jgi:hypothetical protein